MLEECTGLLVTWLKDWSELSHSPFSLFGVAVPILSTLCLIPFLFCFLVAAHLSLLVEHYEFREFSGDFHRNIVELGYEIPLPLVLVGDAYDWSLGIFFDLKLLIFLFFPKLDRFHPQPHKADYFLKC